MNAEGLLAHYERLADAPDAIVRLRRFVLDLAVRGKLLAQDLGDEPASELLEKIATERSRLSKRDQPQQGKLGSACAIEGTPYEIPRGWQWVGVGAVVNSHIGGGTPSKSNSSYWDGDIFWASVKDVGKSKYIDQTIDKITEDGLANSSSNLVSPSHLIVVTRMGLGKISINRVPVAINQDLRALALSSFMSIDYCYLFFLTHGFKGSGLTVKGIKVEQLLSTPFPLPPLAEQHRIVAKVDEFMVLCDQLEAARTQREVMRDRLATVSLGRLNVPHLDSFPADAHFALDTLPALTTRSDQIKQLRQTILNLAVRGKLVPQDPSAEPARSLLKRIASLRSKMLEGGYPNEAEARAQLKKQLVQWVPDRLEPLPAGWASATLMQCSLLVVDCKNKTAPYAKSGIRLIRTTNVRDGQMNTTDQKYVDRRTYEQWSTRCTPEPGDVLITREAPMGEVCLIPPGERICLGQRMMLARLPKDLMDLRFVIYSLQDPRLMDRVQDKPIGATVQHLRVGGVETLLMPVPPLEEQHRIVAKLDEMMALCDQLEASLNTGEASRQRLLDALLHEALEPIATPSRKHPRAAVSAYVISRLASKRNFGRTAHMKHLYLAEARLGLNLGGRYMREAAGPLDTGIYELEKQAEAAGWYSHSVETLASGNEKVSYKPGNALDAIAAEGITVLGTSRAEMDRLIDLMGGLKTEQVEIIATLFAAWNDALLDGRTPDDDWIVKEVREHWHVRKQRFTPPELMTWLGWMRQNDVLPLGHPPRTMQQTTMEF